MATEGISVREFSRREGCSDTLVHMAVKAGKLTKLPDGRMDPALVGTPWRLRVVRNDAAADGAKDPLQAGAAAGNGISYVEALRLKEISLALLRRLDYQHKSGALVEIALARDVVFELCREQRDLWLAWPARVAPLLAAQLGIADLDALTDALTEHVHRQLTELGEPDARFEQA